MSPSRKGVTHLVSSTGWPGKSKRIKVSVFWFWLWNFFSTFDFSLRIFFWFQCRLGLPYLYKTGLCAFDRGSKTDIMTLLWIFVLLMFSRRKLENIFFFFKKIQSQNQLRKFFKTVTTPQWVQLERWDYGGSIEHQKVI